MFYDVVKELCDKRGISISKLALDLKISKSNVTNWKNGCVPKSDKVSLIADYFNVSTDFLLGAEQKNKPTDTVDELDELDIKIVKLFSQLTPQNKQLALAQIGAILNAQDNQLV